MRNTSVSVKLPEPVKIRLDHLAISTHRSRSSLIKTAVEDMLSVEEWQIKGIREALEEADSGNLIAHEDVKLEWEKFKQIRTHATALRRYENLF